MSELEQLMRQKAAEIQVVELPPLTKWVGVEVNTSIGDVEILAVVSALVAMKDSALIKHNSLCAQKRVKQDLNFYLDIHVPQEVVEKGLHGLLINLLPCEFKFNNDITGSLVHDYYSVIDREEVYRLAKPSGRAFAQAVGILIGSEAQSIFDLKKYTDSRAIKREISNLVSIIGVDSYDLIGNEIDKFADEHKFIKEVISHSTDKALYSYDEKLEQVVNSQLVVGSPSFYTYAAACLDIPCIEIFENQEQLNVFSKWSSSRYAAVLRDEAEHFTAVRLETAWKHWHGVDVMHQMNIMLPADG